MGGKTSTTSAPPPAVSSTTITSSPTPKTTTVTTPSLATTTTTTTAPITPVAATTTTTSATTTRTIATATTNATATTPTPTITATAPVIKGTPNPPVSTEGTTKPTFYTVVKSTMPNADQPTAPVSTEGTTKPTFYTVAKSIMPDADQPKSPASTAYARWYKWSKFEQKNRDKGKILWYMGPPTTTTDPLSRTTTTTDLLSRTPTTMDPLSRTPTTMDPLSRTPTTMDPLSRTTTTLTMTTATIGNNQNEASDTLNITATPSFQLRSTAIYSPPHGDRILSGRNELIDTDTSNFKYYLPDNRPKQTVGHHTRATMYRMNTHLKKTPLPNQSSSLLPINSNGDTNATGNNSSLPTFVSRGLQTDLEPQPINSSSTQIRYYEKQQPQIVPLSEFSKQSSSNTGFFHLASKDTTNQPVLPPIEKTPVWVDDQPDPSLTQSLPSYPPPPPRTSILKKPSTVLSQDQSNPLSDETHDKVLEELRKRNKNTKDGTYRVKKIHLLEKNDLEIHPSAVSFNLPPPPPPPPTKANQSISRSEKLFFSQLFDGKK